MAVTDNAVGSVFTAQEFSFGTISSSPQVITYTETEAGTGIGADTTATITSVVTGANGITTITASFAGSTDATVNGMIFTGTVPGNNISSFVLTGNFPGQGSTNLLFTNTPAQQPGTFGTAMLASESRDVTYAPQQMACFASGTLIRTARGDIAIETLAVGDLVVTASGERRPIRWLGHRRIDCSRHPARERVEPVRIAADAFGPQRPARDLHVSPGHAICLDFCGEVLVPASALVDGATIARVSVDEVTYWHVELDDHDVILAENLACESYLEMGNRDFFAEGDVVALAATPDTSARTHADFCRPYHDGGPLLDAIRARLVARAETPRADPQRNTA